MNVENIKKVFREIKKEANLTYARTSVDSLGDCSSCVSAAIFDRYGEKATGIWLKHWKHGMNKSSKDLEDKSSVYISHNITEEQAKVVFKVLSKYFNINNGEYDPYTCIEISEKY